MRPTGSFPVRLALALLGALAAGPGTAEETVLSVYPTVSGTLRLDRSTGQIQRAPTGSRVDAAYAFPFGGATVDRGIVELSIPLTRTSVVAARLSLVEQRVPELGDEPDDPMDLEIYRADLLLDPMDFRSVATGRKVFTSSPGTQLQPRIFDLTEAVRQMGPGELGLRFAFSGDETSSPPADRATRFGDGAAGSMRLDLTLAQPVSVDILPGICPNYIERGSAQAVMVTINGAAGLDVGQIDPASIRLAGVAPDRSQVVDMSGLSAPPPYDASEATCDPADPDGIPDLLLRFQPGDLERAAANVLGRPAGLRQAVRLPLTAVRRTPSEEWPIEGAAVIELWAPGADATGGRERDPGPITPGSQGGL